MIRMFFEGGIVSEKIPVEASTYEKVFYAMVRGLVFERLGTLEDRVPTKDLTDKEKLSLGALLLESIEKAAAEFVVVKRQRLVEKACGRTTPNMSY